MISALWIILILPALMFGFIFGCLANDEERAVKKVLYKLQAKGLVEIREVRKHDCEIYIGGVHRPEQSYELNAYIPGTNELVHTIRRAGEIS